MKKNLIRKRVTELKNRLDLLDIVIDFLTEASDETFNTVIEIILKGRKWDINREIQEL
ncbi:MAG: hypothetical protein IH596_07115 [Bacteroidales bacterium]|nr:hypothetical protein [Bacteroidales bacterium]